MASHEPSLTVLTGPLAGRKLALGGGVDNVVIGADPSCGFHLPTAGVSPIHARLWIDASGATVYDTNSPRGLYINDDRVSGKANLRNGDILWLGTPGEEEAVMIQVVLPPPGQHQVPAPGPISQQLVGDTLDLPGAAGVPGEPEVVDVIDELPPASGAEATTFLQASGFQDAPLAEPAFEATVAEEIPSFVEPAEETAFLQVPEAPEVMEPAVEETVAAEIPSFVEPAEETAFLQVPEAPEVMEPAVEETVAAEIPSFVEPAEETAFLQVPEAEVMEQAVEETVVAEVPSFVEPAFVHQPPAFAETTAMPLPAAEDLVPLPEAAAPSAWTEPLPTSRPRPSTAEPEPVRFEVEIPRTTPPPAAEFDDDTTMMDEPAAAAPATILMKSSPIPAPAPVAPPPPAPPPPKPVAAPKPAAPKPAAPKPVGPVSVGPTPAKAAPKPAPVAPRPAARPTPPPMPAPLPAAPPAPPAARQTGPPVAALALGGLVLLLLLAGGGYFGYRMLSGPAAPPATLAPASVPASQPPATVAEVPPTDTPEVVPPVEEGVTIVGQPTAKPVAPPSGVPTAPPPTQPKGKPTPPPVSTLPAVDPAAVQAQQVAGLLGQADAAVAARSYDAAIGHYEEALKLDPENARALAGKASAAALRDAAKKAFVTGRTVVVLAKQEKGGLAGFEGAAVQKAPDFSGRMEFAVSPAQVKPGDSIRVQVALTNDGKKTIKVSSVSVAVNLNGKKSEVPFSSSVKEIEPGQKATLGELTTTWPEGVTFWAAEATVSANKGDSLRAQVTWK